MKAVGKVKVFSPRGQVIAMLLHVLDDLKGSQSKSLVTACIRRWGLFAYADEDWKPYPSVKEKGGNESRWMTLVAFARLDCVEREWMDEKGRDQWRISTLGKQIIERVKARCLEGAVDVRHGYLWTPKFKKILAPTYVATDSDAKRPWGSIYDDTKFSAILDEFDL